MQVTYDPTAPANAIPGLADIPMAMLGKPSKGQDTGKWDEIILSPDAVVNGAFRSARAIRVTSQGFATPCTLGQVVRVTTNGNYVVKCQLDKVPDAVKAIRAAASEAQKADYKANGPKARVAAPVTLPTVPGQVAAPATDAPAPVTDAAPADAMATVLAELARLQAIVASKGADAAPAMPTVPPVALAPQVKPRNPRKA